MLPTGVQCRDIAEADLPQVAELLTLGFQAQRRRWFWDRALARLGQHATPPGYPRYGHVLESGGEIVGVILQIFSQPGGTGPVRCNLSSWWVRPEFRMYGSMLVLRALRFAATYTNITPAPQTFPILEAQGYRRFCNGRVVGLAWLAGRAGPHPAQVTRYHAGLQPGGGLTGADLDLLRDHAGYGCLSLVCEAGGRREGFVFAPRQRLGVLRLAVLTWCSAPGSFVPSARALGRHLLRHGMLLVAVDADGPLPGLPGRYSDRPKYYRGPDRPAIDDHAYSERAMFGS